MHQTVLARSRCNDSPREAVYSHPNVRIIYATIVIDLISDVHALQRGRDARVDIEDGRRSPRDDKTKSRTGKEQRREQKRESRSLCPKSQPMSRCKQVV